MKTTIVCVMGVAGAGKTTVGKLLASELGCEFLDGDTLHSAANIQKMTLGIPLADADRAPWLAAIHARVVEAVQQGQSLVMACSALKQHYRDALAMRVSITWVYLKASEELVHARLIARHHHFMKAEMLASQFADLEEPTEAIVIDAGVAPEVAVRKILTSLAHVSVQTG